MTKPTPGGTVREQVPLTEWDTLHPQEGDFIVQNDAHNDICVYLKNVFRWRLAGRKDALVLQDHRIDWQVSGIEPHGPDIAVFFDAKPWDRHRGTYPVRDQGARSMLVVEVTSPSTRDNDIDTKVREYYLAGIPYYVIIDPRNPETGPVINLLAYRRTPEGPTRVVSSEPNRVRLPDLDLWLAAEGDTVVALESDGTPIGSYLEVAQAAEAAEHRAEQEHQRAEQEKQRAEQERQRAEQEKQRAELAERRMDQERARAEENARKLADLEMELKRLRGGPN